MNRLTGVILTCAALVLFAESIEAAWNLNITEHTLSNGMKVLAAERPESPVVAFSIYYRVGSVDEEPDMRGMAHYCEHMMFKSTKHLKSESFARWIGTAGGGHSNANTTSDRTCYFEVVPPERLELAIRLEAERMAHLQPTEEEARQEMKVVMEELRLNYLDSPRGRLYQALYEHAFDVHPYRITTIGRMEDLERIGYKDLMRFHHRFYTPANAVAIVVGNFETQRLISLMETFFGHIPRGKKNRRRYPPEPEQTEERRFKLELPVRESLFMAGYKAPAGSDPDNLKLQVLAALLSRGSSTPLGKLSHGDDPVTMYVYSSCRPSLEPDLFTITAVPLPGVPLEKLERRINAAVDRVREKGVTPEEVERAVTQLLAEEVFSLQLSLSVAIQLGEAEIYHSWQDALTLEDRLKSITPADIQAVANRYLIPEHRTTGYLIGTKGLKHKGEKEPAPEAESSGEVAS